METLKFQAETQRLLALVINSLYTNREIFLRELIANASDALDRLRLEQLTGPRPFDDAESLEIRVEVDPAKRTVTIRDNGIGMSREDVVNHIGTIARSGTSELTAAMADQGHVATADLIGRFGVGFYSSFMVADRVTLTTRRADSDSGTHWESSGSIDYRIDDAGDVPRGTAVTLHLKPVNSEEGIEDYTDQWTLSRIVRRYADYVTHPIVYVGPPADATAAGEQSLGKTEVTLNSMRPIWTRAESDLQGEEVADFYRHLSGDWTAPLLSMSGRAEGRWEYSALLFVPTKAPHDLLYHAFEYGLQLYSRKMLVADRCPDLLPRYLRFVRGVVDAGDLPLNVSRQALQDTHRLAQIRRWITRKVLDRLALLKANAPDEYLTFWKEFGRVLKEAVSEDKEQQDRVVPLLLFDTSADHTQLTTIAEYVGRMRAGQKHIYYLTGESRAVIAQSPHVEMLLAKQYEVLLLSEPVDELLVSSLVEVDGVPLRSAAKGALDLDSESDREAVEEQFKALTEQFNPLMKKVEEVLATQVRSVRLSRRLNISPACLVGEEFEMSPQMERLLLHGRGVGNRQRRILELNAEHPIVGALNDRVRQSPDDPLIVCCAELLLGFAALAEGSDLSDAVGFTRRLTELLAYAVAADQRPATEPVTAVRTP
ncbi:MAG: molecular chaperone HtpG [Cyanobacteria bacterium]|nr:molecular chaperone HtpG [Cyanobacteriota bacterium]